MSDTMDDGRNNGRPQPEYGAYAPQGQPQQGQAGQQGQPSAGQYQPNGQSQQTGQIPYGQPYAYQPPYGQNVPGGDGGQAGGPFGAAPGGADWQSFNLFRLIEELLPQRAKNTIRALYGVVGAAAVILGIALLVWPGKTLGLLAIALGIYFIVSGAVRIVSAVVTLGLPAGWRVLDVCLGALLAIGGIAMLRNAMLTGQTLAVFVTLVVGIGWIMEGVMALAESWRLPSSGWAVAYAIISIIAGVVVLFSPLASMVFLVIFTGCSLLVMGVSAIVRAFAFGRPRRK
ncbi:HdeD family acid-resistance protein [Bifidobacterium leontopitheci]|uniref:HdeD family acid-resistance protein n=1 Tax=Bifidobacterium leontopitheci TaxID=2650774 RepID=A0A6I1GEP6_9BIFI|nr:HdeD family acid-resistance protein [Bifidobacterium leontopitheci]KAB7790015.1 hypothetical protein F7D09_1500 [Bifidobacterium leontopitheci]